MAVRQEKDVYLQVKKYTFLNTSGCQDKVITGLFLQNLKDSSDEEEDEDSVNWLRVERLKKDGECVVVEKIYERPQNVHTHIRSKRDSDCSFQYLIDAEDLMKEVDPKLHASALATGLGAYIIAFPLDSFAEDVPETSKLDLVREIYDFVSVIEESASVVLETEDQKPQIILLGIHKYTVDSTEIARRQQVASDLLRRELLGDEGNCNFIYPPGSGIVWAHDMSKYSSLLGVLAENVAEVEISLCHSWIEAYVSSGDTPKEKKLSKPVSKERYKRDIEKKLKVKMTAEELEELLHAYHVLGWLVTHKESVFSQAYLCKVIQCLPNKKGRIADKKIGMMLADKGLAVKFVGEQFIVPFVLKKYTDIPRRSAAPFYLALVKGHHHMIRISITAFWRMVNTVLEEKPWDCDFPNYCNYISLQYGETYCVHVSFVGGVIEVAVEKPLQVEHPQAKIVKGFAEKCQEIQKSLSDALIEIVSQKRGQVKWGFACEEDHLIEDPSFRCVSVTACDTFEPDELHFVCPRNSSHKPTLTLRHKVWFLRKIHEKHQLQEDKDRGVYVIPDKLDQINTDPESNFPQDERPSDAALIAIKPKISNWTSLAIALGVEASFLKQCHTDYKDPTLAYMCAMTVWRNGDRGTWKHLLEAIENLDGPRVADDIAKAKEKRDDWTINPGIEATVQHSYRAEKDDELDLEEGDIVQVFESRNDGWLRGVKRERSGWFPGSHIKGCTQATVQHSYHAEKDDELYLEEGDVVQVLAKGEDGRWRGVNRERTGWFPGTCVKEQFFLPSESKELKALEFQKNLEDVLKTSASVTLKITKCTTIGPPEVGKTHLKCLLLGQEWDPNTGRTDVIRAPEWVEHYIEDSSTWKLFTCDERMQAICRNIVNKKYQNEKEEEKEDNQVKNNHQEEEKDHPEETSDNQEEESDDQEEESDDQEEESDHQEKNNQKLKEQSIQGQHIEPSLPGLNKEENSSEQADENVIEDPSIHALDTSLGHIMEGNQLSDSELEGHILGEKGLLYFVDTGGQEYYHDIHPILITSPSVYFVVFDLMKCMEEGDRAKFFREELIQRPLRSIHAFGTKQVRQSKFLKIHPSDPKIFIIGTHLDQVREAGRGEEIESVSSDIQSELLTKPYKKFLQPDPSDLAFWPIDNTLAGNPLDEDSEDSEYICDLKSEAVEGVYDAEVTVPLSWLILEQTIKTVPEADFFPYRQLFNLCSKRKLVHSEKEFQTMLYIFHILGLFFFPPILKDAPLRDDEIIYTNPDLLYRMTSKLLKECLFRECSIAKETCPQQGVIQDYRKLLSEIGVKESSRESFLNMLQDLKIIVKIKSEDLILFPAALPSSNQVSSSEASSSPGPLLLSFTSSRLLKVCYIPTGFFRLLIADLAANTTWTLDLDKLSRNFVTFDVGTGVLGLLERVSFIEVTFTPSDDSLPSSSSYNAMYQQLKERVLSLWSNVYGQKDESSEQWVHWGFPCESHPEENHTHIAKFIGDEDDCIASCLHPMGRRIQSVRKEQILWLFAH